MSDSQEKCCGECYSHEKCGKCCGHGFACRKSFFFVRWIFGFIILLIVFCVGISIGRFVGEVDSYGGYGGHGYSKMMQYGRYNYGPGMMHSWVIQNTDLTPETLPPAKTTK